MPSPTPTPDPIRDNRRQRWAWVGHDVIDDYGALIGAHGLAVYLVLARFASNSGQSAYPAIGSIATRTALSERQVKRVLADLQLTGLISIIPQFDTEGRQRPNLYALLDPPPLQPLVRGGDSQSPSGVTASPPRGDTQSPELDVRLTRRIGKREGDAPSPPAFQRFAIDDDAATWWQGECATAGLDPATIPLTPETDKWRDEIAAGRRPVPDDAAADWRQWMRRAIPYALTHPTPKEPHNGATARAVGPGARTPGQPDPDAISDEQFREQLAAKLSGILVPPPA